MIVFKVVLVLYLSLLGAIINSIYSQHKSLPLNFQLTQQLERNGIKSKENIGFHTAVKPSIESFVPKNLYTTIYNDSGKYYYAFTEKLFQTNLLSIEEKGLRLVADPLFNFSIGNTTVNDSVLRLTANTRGVRVAGDITDYFSFETKIYETQIYYPFFLDSIADDKTVAFGLGRSKPFKERGHDVAMSTGYISYSPIKALNIQFGHGKHFIGNGYRSLLLSDNTSPAPYVGITAEFFKNKIQYRTINSWMQSLNRLPITNSAEALFKRKGSSFRYLSFAPTNKLQLGLFEGSIYENYIDSIGQVPLVSSFYIPIIGASTLANGLNGKNNVLLGVNLNYNLLNQFSIYSQLMLDDSDKKGLQIGLKYFDVGGLKNSWIQLEYNSVEAYSYGNNTDYILQSYNHSNQELAHPLGASFNEFLFMAHFEKDRWLATGKVIVYAQNSFSKQGLGANTLTPHEPPVGNIDYFKNVSLSGLEISYLFNRKTNMQLFGSYYYRNELKTNSLNKNRIVNFESYWQIGFRTTLLNFYHDI